MRQDLISRCELFNRLATVQTLGEAYAVIQDMPTEPERKKGKWILHPEIKNIYGGTVVQCSECGEKYVVQHLEDEKYCRNCGAKMEAET